MPPACLPFKLFAEQWLTTVSTLSCPCWMPCHLRRVDLPLSLTLIPDTPATPANTTLPTTDAQKASLGHRATGHALQLIQQATVSALLIGTPPKFRRNPHTHLKCLNLDRY